MAEVAVQPQIQQPAPVNTPVKIGKPGGIKVAQGLFLISAILVTLVIFPTLFVTVASAALYPELLGFNLIIYAVIMILPFIAFIILFWRNRVVEITAYLMVVLVVLPSLLFIPTVIGMFVLVIDTLLIIAAVLVYKNHSYFKKQALDQSTLPPFS